MDKLALLQILNDIATILEIQGENQFKVRAYQTAAQLVESAAPNVLEKMARADRLDELEGIGKGLAEKIGEFINSGQISYHQQLLHDFPPGLLEVAQLRGLGAKKINRLWQELGVISIASLEKACRERRLARLQGFGEKSEAKILASVSEYKENLERFLYFEVEETANEIVEILLNEETVQRVSTAGDFRRGMEVVKDLQLVVETTQPKALAARLKRLSHPSKFVQQDDTVRCRWRGELPLSVQMTNKESYPYALFLATGSREHCATLAKFAPKRGLKLMRQGILRGNNKLALSQEEDVYRRLGLPYIPPELRENVGEIDLAQKKKLPQLIETKDLKGVLHVHSAYSDGELEIREIALVAMKAGYDYLGICDHSQSAYYASGLNEDELKQQWDEIDRLNDNFPAFRIFKGIESDILPDGSLDYPDSVLEQFDFIIGSLHSGFSSDRQKMTQRLVRASANPYLTMLGHPSGRLLLHRSPYAVQMERVIEACAEHNCLIEINAHPYRLDLDWRYHQLAKQSGILLSINPDAHGEAGITKLRWGVLCARKGGLTKEDLLNTRSLYEIDEFFLEHRKQRLAKAGR